MNVSEKILDALVDLCESLYYADSDNCTISVGVPDSDMVLEVEVSYKFTKNVKVED